jgi:threonine 3-dehydrogenase
MAAAICRFAGARYIVVTDWNEYRLDIARKMGATKAINPKKENIADVVKELGMLGFDLGLEMSGSPQAFIDMIDNMYNGSKIALLGILPDSTQIQWDKIIFKAIQIKGIYGREMYETWYKMEQMMLSGIDITPVITHHFFIDEFQKAFDIMEQENCGKAILNWEN